MATPAGGQPFGFGVVQRIATGIRSLMTDNGWFGPNQPLPPAAPDSVKGRPWDFPVGINLQYQPRLDQGTDTIDFATLRRAADPVQGGLDLIRIAIETRKDQMAAQKWNIRYRDPKKKPDDRCKAIQSALRRPDKVRTFQQWARPLWDDMLTIDAPAVYFRPVADPAFKLIPDVVDGATIKLLVDANGRTPLSPDPAYQQVIKGLPAVDYTLDELLYSPRNLRSYRYYGMSPVEQTLGILNIGLKRQLHLLAFYTDGNTPDAILLPPEGWNPDQIKQAQIWLDQLTEAGARRKVRILPGGSYQQLKDPKLKDELDDWLARIICYAFSLAPGALVKDMTKATGNTNKDSAAMEGLEPFKLWWKDFMDTVIERCFEAEDLEFAYLDEEISDPLVKAQVYQIACGKPWMTPDEVREQGYGMDALTPEQQDILNPPPPPELVPPGGPNGNAVAKPGGTQGKAGESASPLSPASKSAHGEGLQKKKTKGRVLKPIKRDRPATRKGIKAIQKLFQARFNRQKLVILAAVRDDAVKLMKMTQDDFLSLWDELSTEGRDKLRVALVAELTKVAKDGGAVGLTQVLDATGFDPKSDIDKMLSQVNEYAVEYAEKRAAELVGMKWDEEAGAWIENPNAAWSIDQTTRNQIGDLVTQAEEKGWSNDELAEAIGDIGGFSEDRAMMIARTETAFADIRGNLMGWGESGVVETKEWSVTAGEGCEDCQALDQVVVNLEDNFDCGGDEVDGPPGHPNCQCDLLPGVISQEQIDALTDGQADEG